MRAVAARQSECEILSLSLLYLFATQFLLQDALIDRIASDVSRLELRVTFVSAISKDANFHLLFEKYKLTMCLCPDTKDSRMLVQAVFSAVKGIAYRRLLCEVGKLQKGTKQDLAGLHDFLTKVLTANRGPMDYKLCATVQFRVVNMSSG